MKRRRKRVSRAQDRPVSRAKTALSLKPPDLDIVDRLRQWNDGDYDGTAIMEIAADEIVNLRMALAAKEKL